MKSMIIKALSIISLFAAFSCTSVIHDGLWPLKKGVPSKEVLRLVDKNGKTSISSVNKQELTSVAINADKSAKYSIAIGTKYIHFENQYYAYAFKNDSLIYWGTLLEFARHESPIINELGEEAVKLLDKK